MVSRNEWPTAGRLARRSTWVVGLALALAIGLSGTATHADVIIVGASQDVETVATVSGSLNDTNFNSSGYVMQNWQGAFSAAGLIQFDLGSIPVGSTILSASLTLFHEFNEQDGITFDLYANTSSWDEATTTYNTRPGFDPNPVSSLTINDFDSGVDRTWDVTAVVQAWYSGALANDGLTLLRSPDQSPWPYFAGSGFADLSRRPRLEVTFQPIPEPAALTSLACGLALAGLAPARRRARRAQAA